MFPTEGWDYDLLGNEVLAFLGGNFPSAVFILITAIGVIVLLIGRLFTMAEVGK